MSKLRQGKESNLAKIHKGVLLETEFKCRQGGLKEQIIVTSESQAAKDVFSLAHLTVNEDMLTT